jgi:nitroreductase
MDTLQAIHTRRSIGKLKTDPVPRALIEQLLDAAAQAPNHHKVQPWRFVVLTGNGLDRLGAVMAESFSLKNPDVKEEAVEKTRQLPHRAPLIIAVGVDKPVEPKVLEIENICAAAAACENILLAAHALGLAVHWRTGAWAVDPAVKRFLGFREDQHIISFLYIGYSDILPEPYERPGYEIHTTWMD